MKLFIDGSSGTTGLRIRQRLAQRPDVELITLPDEERRDVERRRWALNHCDAAFLCLPDDAARQAVSLIENERVTVLDTSTAHRTAPGWTYGFPELSAAHRRAVCAGGRIAVPGCHASGFIALIYPLVAAGLLPKDALLTCSSVTGYSGGGKKMIAEYESAGRRDVLSTPRQYALGQTHKHLPEMLSVTGLQHAPVFSPIVADFYSGMAVTVPLFRSQLCGGAGADEIRAVYRAVYGGPVVRYAEQLDEDGFFSGGRLSGRDCMEISVAGCEDRILLLAQYDNLGKGASGAALQCLNLALGADETAGLAL